MKKILTLAAFIPMLLLSLCIVSCGSDDDSTNSGGGGGNTEETADIALYTFTDTKAEYASLELTEDSRYILVKNTASLYGMPLRNEGMRVTCFSNAVKAMNTRASEFDSDVIVGKFTKSNDTYVLDGFGIATIVVKDKIVTVTIKENGKQEQTLNATVKTPTGKESDLTNKLCHTWKITKITSQSPEGSFSATPEEWAMMDEDEAPVIVTMSKLGTYMPTCTDGSSDIAHWRWSNESKGIMQYSWDYTATTTNWDSEDAGFATVSFQGETVVITEDFGDGESMSFYCIRYK